MIEGNNRNSNMFRLIELRLGEHNILSDLDIQFVDDENLANGPYSTVIIGENGSGKSHLLRIVIEVFRELERMQSIQKVKNSIKGGFFIKYILNDSTYEIDALVGKGLSKIVKQKKCLKNGNTIDFNSIELPRKVIANSIMLNDRFPVIKETDSNIYVYRGIRRSPSTAGTRSHLKKTVFDLQSNISEQNISNHIRDVLKFLNYELKLEIVFYPKYRDTFFNGNLNAVNFKKFFTDWENSSNRTTAPYSLSEFKKINNDSNIAKLVNFLNKIKPLLRKQREEERATYFIYDLLNHDYTKEEFSQIEILHKLDILTEPSINVFKNQKQFPMGESSSGEYHLLISLLGLMTSIKNNSLVLIDEPEISLHPMWQMRYIDFLKKIFNVYHDCHFIIATHSHFIVSDLAKNTSALVHMSAKKKITGNLVKGTTYGWAAEQVLLDVFHVPTTRNYYVAERVGAILDLIAKPQRDEKEIQIKVNELRDTDLINLSEEDPLKGVINKLFDKYARR